MYLQKPLTWIEINHRALLHNIALYKNLLGVHVALAPVLKSNAYGHGMIQVASLLDRVECVDWICVVSLSEALQLRMMGIQKPLLVLSILDDDLEQAIDHSIDIVVYDMAVAHYLNAYAQKKQQRAAVHIKIDTGLSRLGILQNSLEFIEDVSCLSHVFIRGIFTHFADSESNDSEFAWHQINNFNALIKSLESKKIAIPLRHTSCSAAIPLIADCHYTMARTGIGIYGLWPSQENRVRVQRLQPNFELQPVLTWKTRIIQIKEIPAGSYIGYDRTYQTMHNARIAILPVGYWDGYDRLLSNKGSVLIKQRLAPIRGRIAMNLMMVEITGNTDVSVGDEVILLADMPGITADDLALQCHTINYEIVTRINPLLPRIIV